MKYNPDKHHRRSIRLPGYDYTQTGMYFITLCIWQRECLLGEVLGAGSQRLSNINDDINEPAPTYIELSRYGQVVQYNWNFMANKFSNVQLDEFVIMPNHIHGIIELKESGSKPLSEIVQSFKTSSARRINQLRDSKGIPVWQRNYYERIIRNEEALQNIREYIINNPLYWEQDELHPNNPSKW
ncbi:MULTISPECIES: transposase [Calothrix]|uniref:Transposase n=2 Tax=Calothrix TaxID=1186 RepID=A0ABR8A2N3_9CYAN|nr:MULTISPECIES: transposase [Calothrix]MBD2194177.1 transposase [Calothrix parietina FACHB-288]MBD2224973.1 transposase [Calothrix anomala FACHB-343]